MPTTKTKRKSMKKPIEIPVPPTSSSPLVIRRLRSGDYLTSSPCKSKKRRMQQVGHSKAKSGPKLDFYNQTFVLSLEPDNLVESNDLVSMLKQEDTNKVKEDQISKGYHENRFSTLKPMGSNFIQAILQLISYYHIKVLSIEQEMEELIRTKALYTDLLENMEVVKMERFNKPLEEFEEHKSQDTTQLTGNLNQ